MIISSNTKPNELKLVKQSINPSDKFISILSLAKKASFNYDTFSKMLLVTHCF
jgi:hypothetical protein